MQFSTPILFLIFNRPDTTSKVFQQIRAVRPQRLFVSADGPRQDKRDERQKCEDARAIIKQVDWDCAVQTNFSEINLGCRLGVSSGINWFFKHVEEGIILEDDCLPNLSFFLFCETMLKKYRNDERIMHIGGTNFQDGAVRGEGSYYFSRIAHVWGWATWRRAWEKYDVDISTYPQFIALNRIANIFTNIRIQKYLLREFQQIYAHKKDTWDIQWAYCTMLNNGLSIIPNRNLITNIGFETNATHTFNRYDPLANRPSGILEEIIYPRVVAPDESADLYTFKKYLNPNKFQKLWNLIRR